jgi:hypothetical protein
VLAAVYYPTATNSGSSQPVPSPNPLTIARGPFPVLLYAHAFRGASIADLSAHPASGDFTSVEAMLRYVASWGCVCVAPDLSWLPDYADGTERAVVLVNYYTYLADVLNSALFAKQLDFSRMVLVGHSRGAAGATQTGRLIPDVSSRTSHPGRLIPGFGHPFTSLSYGLIAPEVGGGSASDLRNLPVVGGGTDPDQGADPQGAFTAGGIPKTLVMIPGANHFGYTDICPADNACGRVLALDENGAISRADQQRVGAEYLAALVRFYALGETKLVSFLNGSAIPDDLTSLNLQVQSQGFIVLPDPQFTHTPVVKP